MTESKTESKLVFYYHDGCPFAQRSWIALLEKEADPNKPVLFQYRMVNKENAEHPATKEFLTVGGPSTVPTAVHNGHSLWESLLLNEYIDATFAPNRPLQPTTAYGKWRVRMLIDKYASKLQDANIAIIKTLSDAAALDRAKGNALAVFRDLGKDIEGPYVLGAQFTLADIAFVTLTERLLLHLIVPDAPEYAKFRSWWEACTARESVKISRRDPTEESRALFPTLTASTRKEYLQQGAAALAARFAKMAAAKP